MIRREIAALLVVILACLFAGSYSQGRAHADEGDPMPEACVTHVEYGQLELGRSLGWVRGLFDIQGHLGPDNPDRYSYEFKTCWATGVKSVRVWFSATTNLTVDWAVVDA